MSIFIVNSFTGIWPEDLEKNDYSCFSEVVGKYGVYIFRDPENGDILYIGEARSQDLKTRVKQNFAEHDTGGTFKKNYMELESVDFPSFKEYIKSKQTIFLTLEQSMLVRALESMLIFTLKPIYNKDL